MNYIMETVPIFVVRVVGEIVTKRLAVDQHPNLQAVAYRHFAERDLEAVRQLLTVGVACIEAKSPRSSPLAPSVLDFLEVRLGNGAQIKIEFACHVRDVP